MSSAIAGYYLGFFLGEGMVMRRVQNWTLNKKLFNSFNDNLMRMQMVLKCMFELLALGQQLDQQIGITLVMALCVLLLYHFGNTLFRTLQPSSGSASNWWQSEILRMRQPTKFKSHLPNFCMQPCSVSLCIVQGNSPSGWTLFLQLSAPGHVHVFSI